MRGVTQNRRIRRSATHRPSISPKHPNDPSRLPRVRVGPEFTPIIPPTHVSLHDPATQTNALRLYHYLDQEGGGGPNHVEDLRWIRCYIAANHVGDLRRLGGNSVVFWVVGEGGGER